MFTTRVSAIGLAALAVAQFGVMPASAAQAPHWRRLTAPVGSGATLGPITATARDDAWAAGGQLIPHHHQTAAHALPRTSRSGSDQCDDSKVFTSRMLRWQAGAWRRVPVPEVGGIGSISSAGRANLWATAECGILHWSGRRWIQVPGPKVPGAADVFVRQVKATGAAGAWLVGTAYDSISHSGTMRGFVQRWDGRTWRAVPLPGLGDDFSLDSLDMRSPKDVWAVGTDYTGNTDHPERLLLLHWDGHTWRRTPQPSTGLETQRVTKVRAFAQHDMWLVGWGRRDAVAPRRPMVLHWNGRTWTATQVPADAVGELFDLARDGHDLQVAGDTFKGWGPYGMPLMLHWTGRSWVKAPAPTGELGSVQGLASIPGGGLWGTGYTVKGDTLGNPLLARRG
ncbi:hypothetical protein GCM10023196_061910 [Actinoallomurus vinaceus]|uniref:Secreted protein n=1 Tax=Actinoallomurus vinaceus TaxID=1080074 RepID=A0ABP8UJU8_9ACTN